MYQGMPESSTLMRWVRWTLLVGAAPLSLALAAGFAAGLTLLAAALALGAALFGATLYFGAPLPAPQEFARTAPDARELSRLRRRATLPVRVRSATPRTSAATH
jgi:hypothetical protein